MAFDPFASILPRLQGAILGEATRLGGVPPIVAVQEFGLLRDFWARRPAENVQFTWLEGRADAVVQLGPCGATLWMHPAADGYRAAYGRFLRNHWGVAADLTGSGYDVDHVYNRARAKHYGYVLVRMLLVRAEANRAHGRGYEKGIGAAEAGRRAKIMKLLDGMSELKVLGLPPVAGGILTAEQRAAAEFAAKHYGISLQEAIATLLAMYGRAHPDE